MGGTNCCGVDFLKCALSIFNIIFLIATSVILGISIWTITDKYQYVYLLSASTYPVITNFLLFAGAFGIFISIIGFCSLYKNNRALLLFYLFSLLLIFLIEIMVGVIGFFYYDEVGHDLRFNLNETFITQYKVNDVKTKSIDFLQENFHCCGALSYADWKYSKWRNEKDLNEHDLLVPDSCCKTYREYCGKRDHPSNINDGGCLEGMEKHLKKHLFILCAVASGFSVIQLFGMIYSCALFCQLSKRIFKHNLNGNTAVVT